MLKSKTVNYFLSIKCRLGLSRVHLYIVEERASLDGFEDGEPGYAHSDHDQSPHAANQHLLKLTSLWPVKEMMKKGFVVSPLGGRGMLCL